MQKEMKNCLKKTIESQNEPGIKYCKFNCSSFSRSLRKQIAAQNNKTVETRLDATPAHANTYDQSYVIRVLSRKILLHC